MPTAATEPSSRGSLRRLLSAFRTGRHDAAQEATREITREATAPHEQRIMQMLRPERPPRQGPLELIANYEGNRAIQTTRSFETQGILLPVNIVKTSISIATRGEAELEISGVVDCIVECVVWARSDAWRQSFQCAQLRSGLGQRFSIVVPASTSSGVRKVELSVVEVSAETRANKVNRSGKYSNPFHVNEQHTVLALERKDSGFVDAKVEDQYIKLRNKRFSLLEIYGKPSSTSRSNASSPTSYCSDGLSNRECIICMSEIKNTIVLPCRHMCLCYECAETIRGRSDKCPLCRQGFRALLHIKQSD